MSQFWTDFKKFLLRGNVLDLAVAVVIGVAFNAVVQAFVGYIIMPIVGAIFGQPSFSDLTLDIGDGVVLYGAFITEVVNFVIIAFSLFVVIKAFEKLQSLRKTGATEEIEPLTREGELLQEIRDLLRAQSR